MRKPRLTEDIAHGLMHCAGMVDEDMAADSDRFDTDPQWQQASRAQEYMVKLARWKLAKVREANDQAHRPAKAGERH